MDAKLRDRLDSEPVKQIFWLRAVTGKHITGYFMLNISVAFINVFS